MLVQSLGRSKTGPSTGDPRLSRTDMVPGLQLRTVDQAHTSAPNPIKTNTKTYEQKNNENSNGAKRTRKEALTGPEPWRAACCVE